MIGVKLCGLRSASDIEAAIELGASAVGINRYPASKRYSPTIDFIQDTIQRISHVGVYVDPDVELIRQDRSDGIAIAQVHSSEATIVKQLLATTDENQLFWLAIDGQEVATRGVLPAYCNDERVQVVVLDTKIAGQTGGTGKQWDTDTLRLVDGCVATEQGRAVPVYIAGGLHAGNVGDVIAQTHPTGVDTASGIEENGQVSILRMKEFMEAANG